jgi:hypothetical protein
LPVQGRLYLYRGRGLWYADGAEELFVLMLRSCAVGSQY